MAWTVFEYTNLKKDLVSAAKPQYILPPDLNFKIEVTMDKSVAKKLEKDPLLQEKMVKPVQKELERIQRQLAMMLKAYDKEIGELQNQADAKAREKQFNSIFKEQVETAKKFAISAMNKGWAEFINKEKQYKKYKIKVGAKISIGAAGLAASIASMAAAPFSGGASAVLSIAGMVKTASSLAQECKQAADSVEKTQKILLKDMNEVLAAYKLESKKNIVARELATHYVDTVLTVKLPSIRKCGDGLKLVSNKLAGIQLKSHDIAKTLAKAMKAAMAIEGKVGKNSAKKLKALEAKIDHLVKKIPANEKRADKALKNYQAVKPVVEGLMAKRPKYLEKIELAMKLLNYAGSTDWAGVAQTSAGLAAEITVDKVLG